MIQYPDTLQASTEGFAIARAKELGGHRQVVTLADLYKLPDAWLSESKTNENNDAIGQEWYVAEKATKYRLVNWANRKSSTGWEEETTVTNADIDSLFE